MSFYGNKCHKEAHFGTCHTFSVHIFQSDQSIYVKFIQILNLYSYTLSVRSQTSPCLIQKAEITFDCLKLCHFVTVSEIMTHYVPVMTCPTSALLETSTLFPLNSPAYTSQFSTPHHTLMPHLFDGVHQQFFLPTPIRGQCWYGPLMDVKQDMINECEVKVPHNLNICHNNKSFSYVKCKSGFFTSQTVNCSKAAIQ